MARRPTRFAEGGATDRHQGRFDRKVADIESDYAKWQKSGKYKDPGIAKAKYEQRMADAKNDLAGWRGEDRTSTSAAEKAAEAALKEARRTGGSSIRDRDAADKVVSSRGLDALPSAPLTDAVKTSLDTAPRRKAPVRMATASPARPKPSPVAAPPKLAAPVQTKIAPSKVPAFSAERLLGKTDKYTSPVKPKAAPPEDSPHARGVAAHKARIAAKIAAGDKPGASGYEKSTAKFYRENPTAWAKGGKLTAKANSERGVTRSGVGTYPSKSWEDLQRDINKDRNTRDKDWPGVTEARQGELDRAKKTAKGAPYWKYNQGELDDVSGRSWVNPKDADTIQRAAGRKPKAMAKGGKIDGIAKRGHTRAKRK